MSAATDFPIKQWSVIEFLALEGQEYCHWRRILGSSLWSGKQNAIHGISKSRFSECNEIQNCSISKKSNAHHLLGCKGCALHGISVYRIDREFRQVLCNLTVTQAMHPQNQAGKKHVSFASRLRKATWQCTNPGCHDKPQIHSGSTPSLQPRFGTTRLLAVPKIEGDVKSSTFFIRCQSWGSCAQMDQQPTRNFLHGRNEQMYRIKKMCSRKWWLCWKISVQCARNKFLTFW